MLRRNGFSGRAGKQRRMQINADVRDASMISKGEHMAMSKELLDILACPQCKGDIRLNEKQDGLICDTCKLLYHIKDDIPIMLIDEATKLE